MKKMILAATILGLAAANLQTAQAGDREWAVVGKVLTGVAAAAVITSAVTAEPAHVSYSYSYSAPGYSYGYCPPPPPRVVYAPPAPVVVYRAPVYVAPAPVYYAPQVNVRVGYGGRRHHHFRHGCW
jgi:hypothetical protein